MNITICKKDTEEGRAIRNWERQCFPCIHAHLVRIRAITIDGELHWFGGIHLFRCPHVGIRHKIIGKDTHESQPLSRTDIVGISGVFIPFIPGKIQESLDWQELQPGFSGYEKTEVAEIPRKNWKEWLDIDAPLTPVQCPLCSKD